MKLLMFLEKEKRKVDKEYGLCTSPSSENGNQFYYFLLLGVMFRLFHTLNQTLKMS